MYVKVVFIYRQRGKLFERCINITLIKYPLLHVVMKRKGGVVSPSSSYLVQTNLSIRRVIDCVIIVPAI